MKYKYFVLLRHLQILVKSYINILFFWLIRHMLMACLLLRAHSLHGLGLGSGKDYVGSDRDIDMSSAHK